MRESGLNLNGQEIRSLDDVPSAARVAGRQRFLNRWYKPVAMAPFGVCVFAAVKFFPDSRSWFLVALIEATLIWAIGVAAYAFYLLFWFKCPRCHSRFGLGERCRACELPRHAPSDMFKSLDEEGA